MLALNHSGLNYPRHLNFTDQFFSAICDVYKSHTAQYANSFFQLMFPHGGIRDLQGCTGYTYSELLLRAKEVLTVAEKEREKLYPLVVNLKKKIYSLKKRKLFLWVNDL